MAAHIIPSLKRPAERALNPVPAKKPFPTSRWNILFVANGQPIEDVTAIGIDQFRICIGKIGERCLLAARGIDSGFAVCQRAITIEDKPIIGLCHTPNLLPIKSVIHFLTNQMIEHGALKRTIQTAIIGGIIPDSAEEEEEILQLAKKQPIATHFNLLEPHPASEDGGEALSGLAVVVDPNQILISDEEEFLLYTPVWNTEFLIDNEQNGIDLPEREFGDESTESDTEIHE